MSSPMLFDADPTPEKSPSTELAKNTAAEAGPLKISRARLRALDFASFQENDPDSAEGNVGFSARVWAQVSLPYRDPGAVPYWERKNGGVSLTMRPALLTREDGTRYEAYAFGMLPRHALTWMATEAVRTNDPVLTLGSSMNSFMAKIGLAKGGRDAKRLTDQLRRLFGSHLSVDGAMANDSGHGEVTRYFQIADQVQLWFDKAGSLSDEGTPLWSSEVTLSDAFYDSIVKHPIPVNLSAMRALGSSPMRLDIYLWATFRVYNLAEPVYIKWATLNHQFGGQYETLRQFKAQFIKNLAEVKVVYPELNVEPTKDCLILRPSATHVAPTKRRLELI